MRRAAVLVLLLAAAGCRPDILPAPEEVAIDRFAEGEYLMGEGRNAEAAREFEFVIAHRWRWKAPYVQLSRCREAEGHDADAIDALERLLKVDDTDEDALRGLGRLYAKHGDSDRALRNYRQLRERHPEDKALAGEIARLEALRKP